MGGRDSERDSPTLAGRIEGGNRMPCNEYEDLKREHKSQMETYAQFTYEQNRHLRGVGDRKAKQLAKEAMTKVTEISNQMFRHRQLCEECKRVD